ncbi:DNA mismatch repair protein Msh2 isoform X2 [Ischnura elegans]|uniref:DNA mismatch repair protein Msh2 isoform X2 n=1 Tax=Ischnura elegans TaxID=197161 RepID=UPI001ED86CAB|nr:DNA mismatch repair protein Msh2 isoform X2 [Ischnura elegans]
MCNVIQKKPVTTIRLFNRTEYYTVHGTDAIFTAKEVFKTSACVKYIGAGNNKIESLALGRSHFEHFVRELLLVKQYRVEVYSGGTKTSNDWHIEAKASPGNLSDFEDMLFNNADVALGSSVLGLKLGVDGKNRVVGVACINAGQRKFTVAEFVDNDVFSTLESVLVQLGPKECLLPAGVGDAGNDYGTIKKILERNNVVLTERKRTDFAVENSKETLIKDLTKLMHFEEDQKEDAATLPQVNLNLAMSALNAGIKYLELVTDERNLGQFTMSTFDSSQFVRVDFAAMRALQVFPVTNSLQSFSAATSTSDNLYALFSRWIRTPAGHRLLRCWLSQPLKDLNHISQRHDVVEALVAGENGATLRRAMSEVHLRRVPDFAALARKFRREKATLQDCYRIYQSLLRLPQLQEAIEVESDSFTLKSMFGGPLKDLLALLKRFQEMVETTIDIQKAEEGDIMVKPEFDEGLQDLRSRMDDLMSDMKDMIGRTARDLSLEANKGLKLESNSQYGYFFRVTLKDEKLLRNNRAYTILDSNKAGVRFQSERLRRANDDYVSAREEYSQQQKAVEVEIIKIAVGYADTLQSLGDLVASLDVIVAFACAAAAAPTPYVRPKMHPSSGDGSGGGGIVSLKQARHPCLETSNSVAFIPNDVLFERGKSMFHIITGPNMGGKSTFLRTVGLSCLMAQVGSFVPCFSAEISVVDAIMCRVGAGDCQGKGISTFMAEMLETSAILRTATANTLILIDELGRGTSTYDGYGLAWAISEYIAKEVGAFTLFATHFHELTSLADKYPSVVNEHVTAHITDDEDGKEGTLTLLYAVKPGVCDQSFGIHVAKIASIPDHVIEFAKLKQEELEDLDAVVSQEKSSDAARRKIKKEGEAIVEKFINSVKELQKKNLGDEELAEAFGKLKEGIKSVQNPYVEAILKSVPA